MRSAGEASRSVTPPVWRARRRSYPALVQHTWPEPRAERPFTPPTDRSANSTGARLVGPGPQTPLPPTTTTTTLPTGGGAEYTFTNCGQTGRLGPSQGQCDANYAATTLAGQVTVTGGIQEWTVPVGGLYTIEALGGQGGVGAGGRREGTRARAEMARRGGDGGGWGGSRLVTLVFRVPMSRRRAKLGESALASKDSRWCA